MTKPIRSFPKGEQHDVARRRVNSKTDGLGYWSAKNFLSRPPQKEGKKEE